MPDEIERIAEQVPEDPNAPEQVPEDPDATPSRHDMERVMDSFQSGIKRVDQSKGVIVIFFENGQTLLLYPDGKWYG